MNNQLKGEGGGRQVTNQVTNQVAKHQRFILSIRPHANEWEYVCKFENYLLTEKESASNRSDDFYQDMY